ncbi:MAG: ATP-binding protein, partial [Pseudomonadota bacterium]
MIRPLPIARSFAGFLFGVFALIFAFAGASVWYAKRVAFIEQQDQSLASEATAIAGALERVIEGEVRAVRYLAGRPLLLQAVVGEEKDLVNAEDLMRSFNIARSLLHLHLYDVLAEPVLSVEVRQGAEDAFSRELRRSMANDMIASEGNLAIRHARLGEIDHLLIAAPVQNHGATEGVLYADFVLDPLADATSRRHIAGVEIRESPDAHAGRLSVAVMGDDQVIIAPIMGTGLELRITPDRSSLEASRGRLMITVLGALAGALSLSFAASYALGYRLIVDPQRAVEESRRQLIASEAKARELASVVEQTNDAILLADPSGRLIWNNRGNEEISGLRQEDMLGKGLACLLKGSDRDDETSEAIRAAIRDGTSLRTEVCRRREDGSVYWLDLNIVPLRDGLGDISGYCAIQRDVTEAKTREAQLSASQKAAEAANRAKSNFLASMSHEIRTPMNGVIGMAELLSETELNDEQRICTDTIRDSANALLGIINDILDFSKIESGKLQLSLEPVALCRVIDDVAQLLAPAAVEGAIELMVDDRINRDVSESREFVTDIARIRQVLVNLLGNAVKFTETGHVLISAKAKPGPAPGVSQVEIAIADTGIGIPEEKLHSIFAPFEQADASSARRFEGTGLGLAITRRLVQILGGDISVSSVLGRGSVFKVVLPLREVRNPNPPALPRHDGLRDRVAMVFSPRDAMPDILAHQLGTAGARVLAVNPADMAAGLAAIDAKEIDIVILDNAALDAHPEVALDTLRTAAVARRIPVLFLASVDQSLEKDRLLSLGLAAVLFKPVRRSVLLAQVDAALNGSVQGASATPAASRSDAPDLR